MQMRKSKLETYEDILGAIIKKPLTIDSIAYETNMDCTILEQRLNSLIKYGLVQERISGTKTLYAITERGATVFKTLSFQKYLEKVASAIKVMDEALQVVPTLSKRVENEEK
jgi:predicted transcriptional regulator